MRVLLDTCILSELRNSSADSNLVQTVTEIGFDHFYISVISIGEIIKGVQILDEGKRKKELNSWVAGLESSYVDRLLAVDLEITRIWGEIAAKGRKSGKNIPAIDGLIAATALRHGLHLMTRNLSDFEHTGVLLLNP